MSVSTIAPVAVLNWVMRAEGVPSSMARSFVPSLEIAIGLSNPNPVKPTTFGMTSAGVAPIAPVFGSSAKPSMMSEPMPRRPLRA